MKRKNIGLLSLTLSALLLSLTSAALEASAENAVPQNELFGKIDTTQLKAVRINDPDESYDETEDISRLLNASSALTDSAFLDSCCKSRYGYTKLSSATNGTKRQSFYNELMDFCISFWHSTEDVELKQIGTGSSYVITMLDFSDNGLDPYEAVETLAAFKNDNPVFYYLANSVMYSSTKLYLTTDADYHKGSERKKHNTNVRNYVISSADTISGETRLCRKAKKLYDKVINDVEYAYLDKQKTVADESVGSSNILGAVENGRSICEGYARIFHLLTSYNGLDTVFVSGVATNSANVTGRHAWNMIKLDDGKYYNFDATWDDGRKTYKYFAVGSKSFSNHRIDDYRPKSLNYMYPVPSVPAVDFDESKVHFHSFGTWTVTTRPTCTSDGVQMRVCSTCNSVETKNISAPGHSFKVKVKAPTCTAQGYTEHICVTCNYSYKDNFTEATGHIYNTPITTKIPNCTQPGVQIQTCKKCGNVQTSSLSAKGHSYSEEVIAPTCVSMGFTLHTCTVCGDSFKDSFVGNAEHTFSEWIITKKSSCTENGIKTRTCKVCGNTETSEVSANGHTYTTSVISPTCTEMGHTLHTCTVCGESFKDSYTGANGHRFGEWQTSAASSCTAGGSEYRICTLCGEREERNVQAAGHHFESKIVEPTCTVRGYTVYTCTGCGITYIDNYTAPKGHVYGDWQIETPPTCTEKGLNTCSCIYCGKTKFEETAPTGHTYNSVTAAPACTEAGYKKYVCTGCGKEFISDIVSAKGHSFGEWKTTVKATDDKNGEKERVCSECGEKETAVIAALGHNFTKKVIAPACTEEGYTEYTCTENGETYRDDFTAPKGHSFGEWQTTVEATCNDCGEEERICSDCGERETRITAKKEYHFVIVEKRGFLVFMKCTVSGEELCKSLESEKNGDIDGDDSVDLDDLAMLQQYLAGWSINIGDAPADINGNGKVDLDDIALVQQYLAGWGIDLNKAA